jgi:cell division septal protein FtsQ
MKKFFKRKLGRSRRGRLSSRKRAAKSFSRRLKQVFVLASKRLFRNKFIKIFLLTFAIAGLGTVGFFFIFSSRFDIASIKISGNEEVQNDIILSELSSIQGKNIFLVRSSQLRSNLENLSPFIKSIEVEKELPDTILVNVEEREEKYILINLAGCFLLDSEGIVLEVISDFEDIDLSSEDIDILKGYGNLAEIEEELRKREDQDDETEESEVDEEKEEDDLTEEEVEKIFEQRRLEVISKVEQYWEDNLENLNLEDYSTLQVYSYDKDNYSELSSIDQKTLEATNVWTSVESIDGEVTRFIWESSSRFVVYVDKYRKIIFSTRRDINEEMEDLRILLDEAKKHGEEFLLIDLSSEVIVYEVDE